MATRIRFTTQDPLGRLVALDEEAWAHIQREHTIVKEPAVRTTLEAPGAIWTSRGRPTDYLYFLLGGDPKYPRLYTKVVVDRRFEVGYVRTAMYQEDFQGADFERGLKYVYRRV